MSAEYDGQQIVGIDLHRRRSVIVRMSDTGEQLGNVRIDNDPMMLAAEIAKAGERPQVVLEATYGWHWAVDVLRDAGADVYLAHPLGVKGFAYRRVKNDVRDAADLADLLRMGRLPEGWIAPPEVRELRELVRHRALCGHRHKARYAEGLVMPRNCRVGWPVAVSGMRTSA
jgi:transposase